jgi:hypothetical protein
MKHSAAVAVALAFTLTACGSGEGGESADPVLAALKSDPMGTREPEGFTLVDSHGTPREERGVATGKPTQASWVRDFRSTAEADDSNAVLDHLAQASQRGGWEVGYSGPSDLSATKTIDGEPAVLYVSIEPASPESIAGAEEYSLQISLRS